MLFEKDLDGRDALSIIIGSKMKLVLQNDSIEKASLELWDSEYDVRENFLRNSSSYQLLFDVNSQTLKDEERERRFYRSRDLSKYTQHFFMFEVWKKSMGMRNFSNFVTYLLIGGGYLLPVVVAMESFLKAQDAV